MRNLITAVAVVFAFSATDLFAEDWTEFRGPTADGHSNAVGLPVKWSVEQNVVWKRAIDGLAWSSPIVLGDRIYLTTSVANGEELGPEQSLRTLCLDAESGAVEWDVEVFRQKASDPKADKVHRKNSHASATPITDGRHLFVHFGMHGTACLTLDGKIVWKNQELKYVPVHGNGGSPVLVDGLLVVSCDGGDVEFIAAMDQQTGDIRWKTDRTATHLKKKFAFGTPLLISVEGKTQIVSQGAGAVYGYDPKDGSVIWKVGYVDGYSVVPRPVFAHGLVYVSSGFDKAKLLAIDPSGKGDITATHVRWTLDKGAPHTPSPLVVGDEIYVVSDGGVLSCLDAKTGELHYQERLGGKYSASPLFADGKIYVQAEEGEGIVFRPGKEFMELGRNELEARTFASYSIFGSSLLIRSEK
ncbi:MAG: PQQ-binding-like beta-propeller repeat protein, partial [Rhodopirellula sp.]|nr:PQQ-binding-like beta-propeller repeat protein [Rhodopirellula sp.]